MGLLQNFDKLKSKEVDKVMGGEKLDKSADEVSMRAKKLTLQ